jgi:hypothetical protein
MFSLLIKCKTTFLKEETAMQLELIKAGINKKTKTLYGVYFATPDEEGLTNLKLFTKEKALRAGGAIAYFFDEPVPNYYSAKKVYDKYFNYDGNLKNYADVFIDRELKNYCSPECMEFLIHHEIGHIANSHGSDNNKVPQDDREVQADRYASMVLGRNCYNELYELLTMSHKFNMDHGTATCSLEYLLRFHEKRLVALKNPKRKIV